MNLDFLCFVYIWETNALQCSFLLITKHKKYYLCFSRSPILKNIGQQITENFPNFQMALSYCNFRSQKNPNTSQIWPKLVSTVWQSFEGRQPKQLQEHGQKCCENTKPNFQGRTQYHCSDGTSMSLS